MGYRRAPKTVSPFISTRGIGLDTAAEPNSSILETICSFPEDCASVTDGPSILMPSDIDARDTAPGNPAPTATEQK